MADGFRLRYANKDGHFQDWAAHIVDLEEAKAAVEGKIGAGYELQESERLYHGHLLNAHVPEGEVSKIQESRP